MRYFLDCPSVGISLTCNFHDSTGVYVASKEDHRDEMSLLPPYVKIIGYQYGLS